MEERNIDRNDVAKGDTPVRSARPTARAATQNNHVEDRTVNHEPLSGKDQRTFAARQWLKPFFIHLGILAILFIYCFVGAVIFQAIEAPREIEEQQALIKSRDSIIQRLWNSSHTLDRGNWTQLAAREIQTFATSLDKAFHHGTTSDPNSLRWNFYGSLFFAATVVSTIGYGHHAPVTPEGRIVCILYALVGIPLYLFCVADLGLLLARTMTRVINAVGFKLWRYEKEKRKMRFQDNTRGSSSKTIAWSDHLSDKSNCTEMTTNSPRDSPQLQRQTSGKEGAGSTSSLKAKPSRYRQETIRSETQSSIGSPEAKSEREKSKGPEGPNDSCQTAPQGETRQTATTPAGKDVDVISLSNDTEGSVSDRMATDNNDCSREDQEENPKLSTLISQVRVNRDRPKLHPSLTNRGRDPRLTIFSSSPTGTDDTEREEQGNTNDDGSKHGNFKIEVPLWVVILLFLLYNVMCAFIIGQWEGWDFLTSFYFTFITLSTIGFGDVFPAHQKNLLGFSVIVLFGMAVLTMCISLAQNRTYTTVKRSMGKFKSLAKRTSKTGNDTQLPTIKALVQETMT